MNIINVTVREKIARASERARIVCGNSDYAVQFDFDGDWSAENVKTARFTTDNGIYTDVQFEGDTCTVPILANTRTLQVGVYAGNLRTTTAALIHAVPCITDPDGTPADPTPDVYNQLMERFNAMEAPAAVLYEEQELTYDSKRQARENIQATGTEDFTIVNTYNEIASCGSTSGVCRGWGNGTPDGLSFPVFFLFSGAHYGKRHVTMLDGNGQFWGGLANNSEIQNMAIVRTVPVASPSVLGGVQPVAKTDEMTVPVGVDTEGKLYTTVPDESRTGLDITNATAGQIPQITAVDADGAPTAWEAVDLPSGGGSETWELISSQTVEEDVLFVDISVPSFTKLMALVSLVNTSASIGNRNLQLAPNGQNNLKAVTNDNAIIRTSGTSSVRYNLAKIDGRIIWSVASSNNGDGVADKTADNMSGFNAGACIAPDPISQIRISNGNLVGGYYIGAGTRIKVYVVRGE